MEQNGKIGENCQSGLADTGRTNDQNTIDIFPENREKGKNGVDEKQDMH